MRSGIGYCLTSVVGAELDLEGENYWYKGNLSQHKSFSQGLESIHYKESWKHNIPNWKGPRWIIKSYPWLYAGPTKIQIF